MTEESRRHPELSESDLPRDLTTLVLAPTGRDATLLVELLSRSALGARAIASEELLPLLSQQQGGLILVAEEALSATLLETLGPVIENQPTWADFPFIVLTSRGGDTAQTRQLERERVPLLNHTLLERPLRPNTLVASVRSALRARAHQYDIRDTFETLRRTSLALESSEERNRLILQSTRDCIKLLDLDGNLLTMNAEGQERFAIREFSEVRGRPWIELWRAPFRTLVEEAIAAALAGGAGRFEAEFERADGELSWWDVSVTSVRDPFGVMTNLLAVSREISTRKRAEKALIESEKLAAVGRLAASISHEINNPLEAVTNLLYIVATDETLSLQAKAYLAMADRELARVSQIAGQTLRFHRQATRPRSLTARELIDPVLALYQGRLINSGITINIEVRDLQELTCYEGDIRQVLNNLVGNAVDAMRSSGGTLRIRAQHARDWSGGNRHGARITIADTGHGMPRHVAQRIFEAFYTTKGINGNGLGLWISQGIVAKHKGRLRVRSRHAAGASAGVSPVVNLEAAAEVETARQPVEPSAPSGTVFTLFLPADMAEAS